VAAAAFFFGRISGGEAVRENLPKNRNATRQAGKRAGLPLIIGELHHELA